MKKITLSVIVFAGIAGIAFAQKDSTVKSPTIKIDTVKTKETGAIQSNRSMFAFIVTLEDSSKTKAKPKVKADTLKTGSVQMNAKLYALYSPQTDSIKTKPGIIKSDTLSKPSPEKKTGAIYFDKKTGSIMALPKEFNEEYYSEVV